MIEIHDENESFTHIKINGNIEFGKVIIDTLSVFEEGYQFSPLFRSGIWNGKKEFYTILEGQVFEIPKGLINYIIKDLQKRNIQYTYSSSTIKTDFTIEGLREFINTLDLPFPPYDYQEKAVFDMIKDRRMTIKSATGCMHPKTKILCKIDEESIKLIEDFRK